MKRLIQLILVIILSACSSSNDSIGDNNNDDDNSSNFSISLSALDNAVIDESIAININANETLNNIQSSLDNFETTLFNRSDINFGTSTTVHFAFDALGEKSISIKAKNSNGDEVTENVTININRGDAVKINQIKVLSFSNIDGIWDSEFGDTDSNRLADYISAQTNPIPFENQNIDLNFDLTVDW